MNDAHPGLNLHSIGERAFLGRYAVKTTIREAGELVIGCLLFAFMAPVVAFCIIYHMVKDGKANR